MDGSIAMYRIVDPTASGEDVLLGKPQLATIALVDGMGAIAIDGVLVPGVIADGSVSVKPGDRDNLTTVTLTLLVGDVAVADDIAAHTEIDLPLGSDSRVYYVADDDTQPYVPTDLDAVDAST